MTHNASGLFPFNLAGAARAAAGLFAVMTAIAGLILAGAALVMRFSGRRPTPAPRAPSEDEPLTLDARRTPRGWTVE